MNLTPQPALPDISTVVVLMLLLVAPLALAGLALINAGLGRSRSAAQSILGSVVVAAVAVLAFALVGAALAGGTGHAFQLAGRPWNWVGSAALFLRGAGSAAAEAQLKLLYEMLAVALAAMIPWGSGADRLRIDGGAAVAAVLGGIAFPLLAHWVWNGGWLAQLGVNFSLGSGFADPAGAATVHVMGGLAALAVVWITGPRRGKFPKGGIATRHPNRMSMALCPGIATAMPGQNAIDILFGCLVATAGWLAFNIAGSMLWQHATLDGLPIVGLNTLLSAAGAVVAAFVVTRIRFGKPDASLCGNGFLAGLVASSATAGFVSPMQALLIGLVAGVMTPLLVEMLELAVSIDDPSGAISVHGAGGLWGLIAAGLFAPQAGQLVAQMVGSATLLGLMLPLLYAIFWLINRLVPFRVEPEGERIGMDLQELGGGAFPEFVIHREDPYR
jgi:Amt family ammonium transporter